MLDYRLRHPEWEWAKAEWVLLSRSPEKFIAGFPCLARQTGVSFVGGDVRDFAFPSGRFDAVVHAATSAVNTLADGGGTTSVVVDGTRHVVDFAKAAGCMKVLFTSSGAVYGPRTSPASEEDECNPVTAYGKGKLAAERILVESGLDVKIARCYAFVGRYLPRTIHFAIGNFIQDCLEERDIVIRGDGTPLRSYLYADDLVEWLSIILERGVGSRVYNVGSPSGITIYQLARRVSEICGGRNDIRVLGESGGRLPGHYYPNVDRAKFELGLKICFDLDAAIEKTYKIIRTKFEN